MDIKQFRHPKERSYFLIAAIISTILHICTLGLIFVFCLIFAIPLWISEQFFKALVFGNAIKINENQFPSIYKTIQKYTQELNLKTAPEVFICNGQGLINAVAIRFLSRKYAILLSNLVDLMLKRGATAELDLIIGHELAHHALGHTSALKNAFLLPSRLIPFLFLAYTRGCEYSADRVGFELSNKSKTALRGLLSITLGSEALSNATDFQEFVNQENNVPGFFGYIANAFSTHPRMTKRIIELLPNAKDIVIPKKEIVQQIDDSKYMPKT